jgi:hypothetical protein
MQLELIGCTSAGKSTLSRSIFHACYEQGVDIVLCEDFVLKQVRLDWIKSHLPRTLLVNLLAIIACVLTWRTNLEFYVFAAKHLLQLPIVFIDKLNLFRNVLRKIGTYEIIRHRNVKQQIVLADEGILQAAHHLFVHDFVQVKAEHLATFTRLIPFPDVIVYLRQPESLLIDRTMQRGHQRIPDCSHGNVVRFIRQAVAMFDKLIQIPAVESKLLFIDGGQEVAMAAADQNSPLMYTALEIIRKGLATEAYESCSADPFKIRIARKGKERLEPFCS